MSQPRPSIIPSDYDYSDYVSDSGSGEAGPHESQGLVTRRPLKRGQSRGRGEDGVRGQDVYEAAHDRDDGPVNWSKHKHPETRRSHLYRPSPYPYSFRRYGDQRSSGTVSQRSDDYGHDGYGHGGHHGGGGCSLQLPGLCALLGLGALLAVGGAAVAAIVLTVTMGRKRKRSFPDSSFSNETAAITKGLEEFEEKIDKIAEGQDSGDDNWISKIYNQFSFFNDVDNSLSESDLDGIEPPILDETWGLGLRNSSTFKKVNANTTVEDPVKLEQEGTRKKREVIDVNKDEDEIVDSEEKCRVDMWRCLSSVIEGGLHYIDNPEGLYGLAKKTMFKVAFHGGVSNVWSGLMTIPEARQIKKCMTSHQECVSYEVLRREAKDSMDPNDPSFAMYNKKTNERLRGEIEKTQKTHKRERLIINPEFVESMDLGDGAEQFDADYSNNQV